jgi:hypothetical protein
LSQGNAGGAEAGRDPNYVWDFGWIKILGGDPNVERQPHEGYLEGVFWAVPLSRVFKWLGVGAKAAGTVTDAAGNAVRISEYTIGRVAQRGISQSELRGAIESGESFLYPHSGQVKTGYYDSASNVFVGSAEGSTTTVLRPRSLNYIENLRKTYP